MTENSSLLKQAFLAVQEMQAKLDAAERTSREPIAVIGMGCRLPGGAVDAETFWELLREGRDAVSTVPPARWNADDYYDPDPDKPGKMVTRRGGFLDQVDGFDARFFEIAPREATSMDPQQRLALEVAWETLENAGYAPASLRGSKSGVFLGIASRDYSQIGLQLGDPERMDGHYALGVSHSVASGRISYLLGLQGPSISLDTACSSSLVAVHLACQSLRTGDCTLALAGGVNLMLAPETTALLSRLKMLSPGGTCKTFDEGADGFVRGEGCGFVALKRLSQAQADGDRILAVIRGSAVNQDGASSSLTAPNGPAQVALMRQALATAGVKPDQVSYIEAHGTGTPLGDPIELQALGVVYGAARPSSKPLAVGSLKTNIGHLETSAGIAGLLKIILACGHRQIPPHLHLQRLTPQVRWDELRLTVPQKLMDWEAGPGTGWDTRIAAVSSFGYSGTNAHVVVEEAPPAEITRREIDWPVQILTASAKTNTALQEVVGQYLKYLEQHTSVGVAETDLRDFCFTANTGRSHFSHRACFVSPDAEAMKRQLTTFAAPAGSAASEEVRICFLFTGQGSQYVGMGRELYEGSAVFHAAMERCAAAWKEETGESLIEVLYPGKDELGQAESRMKRARYAQPSLFAFEYAMAELWRSWGILPSVLLGHSLGEYVAAVIAGVFSVEDGMRLVCARARLMDTLTEAGAMRSIAAPAEQVREAIAGLETEVGIGVINGAETVVLSGLAATVDRVGKKLEADGIRTRALEVTHAFHSPLLEPILDEFEACAEKVTYHAPQIRIISNLTGKTAQAEQIATARYWREHMRGTVQFDAGLKSALATGCQTLLEIGPQPHLLSLGKSGQDTPNLHWLPSVRRGRNPWLDLLSSVKILYELGTEINWKAFHGKSGRPIALPTYPFERQRCWFPMRPGGISASVPLGVTGEHPLLGLRIHSPLPEVQFASQIGPDRPSYLGDRAVAGRRVLPAAAYLDMALSAATVPEMAASGELSSVRAVAFLEPCVFDEPRNLQCVLRNEAVGHSFAIYSCASENEAETDAIAPSWILHATGSLSADTGSHYLAENLNTIRERCGKEEDSHAFYDVLGKMDVQFGASFCPLTRVFRGTDEALVEFALPADIEADADRYQIHPVVLDACFQSVVAILLSASHGPKKIYLPVALDEFQLLGDSRMLTLAHARLRPLNPGESGAAVTADVYGFDRSGRVVLAAIGLVFRPLNAEDQKTPRGSQISNSIYEVAWIPVDNAVQNAFNTHRTDARQSANGEARTATNAIHGTWVLAGTAQQGLSSSLANELVREGVSCAILQPGEPAPQLGAIHSKSELPITDLVYFATGSSDISQIQSAEGMKVESQMVGQCLRIVQALLAMDLNTMPRLWIVTRGAQGPVLENLLASTLWGFGRSVAAEYPEMRVVRLDLDPSRETTGEELSQLLTLEHSLPALAAEDELAWRGNELYCPRLRSIAPVFAQKSNAEELNERLTIRTDGAYLVTGGLAGIGLAVAEWLSKRGAAQVILLARSVPGAAAVEAIEKMRSAGTTVSICQGDVSKETDVSSALRTADLFLLRGVFHCAGVLDDGALLQQSWERFERVLSPKLEGAWHLHRLTLHQPLDHFVLFSSIASIFGSEGQANHAAANAFLDAMAQYRQSRGLPALSVNWGPWSETGAAVQLRVVDRKSKMGVRGISTRDGLQALEMLIADGRAQAMVAPIEWQQYFANRLESQGDAGRPLLRELRTLHAVKSTTATAQKKKNSSWLPQLEPAAPALRMQLLVDLIGQRVKSTLGIAGRQEIDPKQPLQELGLDSLLSIELRNSLGASFSQTLPATLLFNYSTLEGLAGFICREVFGDLSETETKKADSAPADLLDDIEGLSDEEVDRQLSLRATGGTQ